MKVVISFWLMFIFLSCSSSWAKEHRPQRMLHRKVAKMFVRQFAKQINQQTQNLINTPPTKLGQLFNNRNDQKQYMQLVKKVNFKSFPQARLKDGEWYIQVVNHTIHYSYLDVAQGIIWIDQKRFRLHRYEQFYTFTTEFKHFLRTEILSSRHASIVKYIIPTAEAAIFSAKVEDILLISVAGYISVNYEEAGFFHGDDDYAKLLTDTLSNEIQQATIECRANKTMLKQSSGVLNLALKDVFDSLKKKGNFDEYKIISSLLAKHAKNRDEVFWHVDFRKEHPECLQGNKLTDEHCNDLKREYSINKKTPLVGSFGKNVALMPEVIYRGSMDTQINAAFDSPCEKLFRAMLPRAYMPKTKELYQQHINRICKSVENLKQCLVAVDRLNINNTGNKRFYDEEEAIDGQNSTFDRFQTDEVESR